MEAQKVKALINTHKQEFIDKWIRLVALSGNAREKEAMDKVCSLLSEMFEAEGFECRMIESGEGTASVLVGTRGGTKNNILFSGHYDTVFKEEEWKEAPYITDDGKLRGPGALDMKGGIITALFTSRILSELGREDIPLKILFVGDEEIGHEGASTADIIKKESEGCAWALNLETGFENSDVCIGRKGTATLILTTHGVSSHPGNAFEAGRNAILEMSHKLIEISELTDLERGVTVSADVIRGGTASNVVPAECRAEIDLRFSTLKDFDYLRERISEICGKAVIEGTKAEISYAEMLPPYETTEGVLSLFEKFQKTARDLGQDEIKGRIRGGASDAAYIGQAGVPVLCATGVSGAESHSHNEWADVESLSERTALFTMAIGSTY